MALKLGCTVSELEHRLTAAEWDEWLGLYRFDPWDDDRRDYMLAQQTALMLNLQVKREDRKGASDFLPYMQVRRASVDKKEDDAKALKDRFKALVAMSRNR